jgi:outer membrane receptor protein involved in Fe transport
MKSFFEAGRRTGLFASVGIAALAIAAPAVAQDAGTDDETVSVDTAEAPAESQVITVTGSRIRNPSVENLEPTTSINSDYLEQRNFINVADALNDLPIIRGSVTPNDNQGSSGVGVNFVNIFALGSQRSLSLINGRRVVSSNSPSNFGLSNPGVQVDLNIIPTALVERVDIVSIGGAPVYGSDAIAGTVNFILKDNFEGLELNGTTGITEQGDAFRFQVSGTFGTNFADGRGNITVTSFYSRQDGLLSNARANERAAIAGCSNATAIDRTTNINPNIGPNANTSDGVPAIVLCTGFGLPGITQGGVVDLSGGAGFFSPAARAGNLVFNPDGTLRPIVPGTQDRAFFGRGGDAFRFSDFEQLTSDLERFSTQVYANFDLTDNINLFFEGLYFESVGTNLVEQPGFNTSLLGGGNGSVFFRAANPLLTPQARATLLALGDDDGDPTTERTFEISRVNLDLANTSTSTENQLLRFVGGARGEFNALGDNPWNYEVSFNYGRSKIVDLAQDIDIQNYVNALSECRTDLGFRAFPDIFDVRGVDARADQNCVPVSLFGFGTASDEAIDYITFENVNISTVEQYVFNANVGGDLFKLFDNPVSFNVGYEFRREEGFFDASEPAEEGRGLGSPVADVGGAFEINEVFGEVFVPIISPSNDFFINRLDVFGRARYVDNSVNGNFTAWSAGGAFGIVRDITFRGNYTKSFRAPAINELFQPQITTTGFVADLCSPQSIRAGAVPDIRERNCNAFLAAFPNATPLLAQNAAVPQLTGGNPNLRNEVADSFTFGVIVEPRWIPNLQISVDYIDIEIADPIVSLTPAAIAGACFDNANFNTADPANGNQFCSLIRRDANGQVPIDFTNPAVTTGFVNGALIQYSGIEGTLAYRTGLDGLGIGGNLLTSGSLTYVRERFNSPTGVNVQRTDGVVGDPEFRGQVNLQYVGKNFGFGTVLNYFGEQLVSRFNRGPSPNDTREFDKFDDFVTVDANISFNTDNNFRFNVSVTNLFDRQGQEYFGFLIPQTVQPGNALGGDFLGRRFTASVTKRF